MTRERDEIIELVEKLLAMTEDAGCTSAEAVAFALRAQRLIVEYDISEEELGSARRKESIDSVKASPVFREWANLLADVVARNFRCRVYVTVQQRDLKRGSKRRGNAKRLFTFLGYATDATAAAVAFDHLYRCGNALAVDAGTGKKLKSDAYKSFTAGYVSGIASELEKQSQALMIVVPMEVNASYEHMEAEFAKATPLAGWLHDEDLEEQGWKSGRDAVRSGRLGAEDRSHLLV